MFAAWFSQNWASLIGVVVGVAALVFTGRALFDDADARRIQNRLAIGEQHRAIWSLYFTDPDLKRILDSKADPVKRAVTPKEELFVTFLILNLNAALAANKVDLYHAPKKLRDDIRSTFSYPVPRVAWESIKRYQSDDLVTFMEAALDQASGKGMSNQ